MTNITSNKYKIQVEESKFRGPLSESLIQNIGSALNWNTDKNDSQDSTLVSQQSQINAIPAQIASYFPINNSQRVAPTSTTGNWSSLTGTYYRQQFHYHDSIGPTQYVQGTLRGGGILIVHDGIWYPSDLQNPYGAGSTLGYVAGVPAPNIYLAYLNNYTQQDYNGIEASRTTFYISAPGIFTFSLGFAGGNQPPYINYITMLEVF